MEQYNVTGMSCAACVARVEKAVNKIEGVSSCSVSLLTNSMGIEGDATPTEIINAVEAAGYGASVKGADHSNKANNYDEQLEDKETPVLMKRLITSVGFLAVLMYLSMGHMMWDWPIPEWLNDNHIAMGLLQMLLTIIIMVINQKFFISGFKGLIHGSPNMDTLVALGSMAAFVYSTYGLFAMTDAQLRGDSDAVMGYMMDFYFESAAMILTLITVGKMLEAKSKGRTTDALKGLMKLVAVNAVVVRDGTEQTIPIEEVQIGDLFVVRPGENIPVDGVIIKGESAIDESALTGESIPVDKKEGNMVSAATANKSGFIKCRATRVGEDTTLSQIIKMVSDAAATKAPIAKVADKVSGVFVPVVITIAIITIIGWLISGAAFGYALARGISVLVISCPCALGLATPVAIMVGNGMGAKNGILFKTSASLEETGKVNIIALDKTGTITKGEPVVTDIIPANGFSREDLLRLAFALERKSEHPLARAIVETAQSEKMTACDTTEFEVLPGNGLMAVLDGEKITGGSLKFISSKVMVETNLANEAEALAENGKTPLLFTHQDKLAGIIAVSDVIKEDSKEAVEQLKNMGIRVVMLTGDNERTANYIGKQAHVDEVVAGVLPDGKEEVIRKLKEYGKVAMVGDGINDAPALTRADIGIAIGAGADIAIDAADVVLMKSSLLDVPVAIRLSRKTLKNIHENLFWAFVYNIIGIPLAAGVYVRLFGWELNPMFAAAAMSLSSFCVVTNALRLNLFRLHDSNKDRKIKNASNSTLINKEQTVKGEKKMTKTIKIEGMMCGHCEATVKKALEALPQVTEAVVSHDAGTAVITLNGDVDATILTKTVEDKDFKVTGIE